MKAFLLVIAVTLFSSCSGQQSVDYLSAKHTVKMINSEGKTIATRFNLPTGYERMELPLNSFGVYLRNFPLKPDGSKVFNYDGTLKRREDVYCAVADIETGDKDLQQCADAVMRLRAEFLYSMKQYDRIHFNFTSGDRCEYVKYAEGFRPTIKGNSVTWAKTTSSDYSYRNFRNYLHLVFTYAGTLSLSKELVPVPDLKDIQIGDVFIQGGTPGHAVIVADVALNLQTSDRIFILAQSYMPAQDIQILVNKNDSQMSPWYSVGFGQKLETPEWVFDKTDLKRFAD